MSESGVRRYNLDPALIAATIDKLCQRVEVRFPSSGLAGVCRNLHGVALHTSETVEWIGRPLIPLRVLTGLLVLLILAGLAVTVGALRAPVEPMTMSTFIQVIESAVNDVLFVAAAIFFLVTIEARIKRRRALQAIHQLRSIAHVIDMHQLTKDPEWVLERGRETGVLPARSMSHFELSRYLDYCSEALSLTGKVAALHVQNFQDAVALQAVNEVEDLTTGLSRKIWQKLTIIYSVEKAALPNTPEPS